MNNVVKPVCVEKPWAGGDTVQEYTHDAFGMVGMSIVTGNQTLFGSDLNHGQTIRIRVSRAKLVRGLSNDWFHADSLLVDISLSHNQFAEFITNPNRGDGIPCTINYAPEIGTPIKAMPSIDKIESKMDMMKAEIRSSAKDQMAKIQKAFDELSALVESGGGKKYIKEAMFSMKCHIENTPGNMAFVVNQAEETLDRAVSAAKIDVEAYCHHKAVQLGYASIAEAAKKGFPLLEMSASPKTLQLNNVIPTATTQGFLENNEK